MDHDKTQRECYEFLDLSDVDDSERNHLTTALYSSDHNQHASWVHDNDNTAVDQNIPAVQNSWHETPFGLTSEQIADVTSATPSVVRNLVMPRLLTPLGALPIYAIVKPSSLAHIAAVPTLSTPTTHVLSGAVTLSSSDIDYIKDNHSQSAMSPQPTPQVGANQQQPNMNNQHQQQQHQQQHAQNNQAVYAPQQQYIGQVGTQIGGAMYQMLPHVMPNVYVSNVTANGNVHGYMTQAIPQYMTNTTPTFVHLTEANQGGQLHEHQQATNANANVPSNIRGSSRRGRGRGNGHRREYIPRQPPQQQQQQQQQHQQQQQQQQQQQEIVQSMMESQQVLGGPSGFTQYYPINPYWVGHPSTQHASGSAVYLSPGQIPMYAAATGHQMYAYHPGMMYQAMIPPDYGMVLDEKNEEHGGGPENMPNGSIMQQMWHPHLGVEYQEQQMEMSLPNQEEMLQLEMIEDVNQNIMQMPMQMSQHQPHPNQIPQQMPMHSPHVLNPNVATFTSLKSQQQQYQNDYMVSSNMMVQQSIQHSNNQQMTKIHQVQHQQHPPPQPTPPTSAVMPPVLHQQNISEQISVNNPNKHIENKNVNYNKDLTQVPPTLVTNMNIKVPVAATATNINTNNHNKHNNSNFINNVNRISNNNSNSVNTKINQNVPNPSSNSTDLVVSVSGNSTSFVNSNINDDTVNQLAKATNEKLMIKNERGNKPPAWNNNNNNSNIYSYNNSNNNNKNVNISNVSSVSKKVCNTSEPTVNANSNSCNVDTKMQPAPSHTTLIVNYNQPIQKIISTTNVVNQTITSVTTTKVAVARQKLSPPPFANNPAVVKSNNSPFVPKSNQINSVSSIMSNSSATTSAGNNSILTDPIRNVSQMVNKKTEIQKLVVTAPQNTTAIINSSPVSILQSPQPQLEQSKFQTFAVESTALQNSEPSPVAIINKSIIPLQISKESGPIVTSMAISSITNNVAAVDFKEKQQNLQLNTAVLPAAIINPAEPVTQVTSPIIKEKESVTTPQPIPVTQAQAPSTKSWASLFVGGKSSGTVVQSPIVDQMGKKPVAKVFPFEGTVNYNPIQTPGGISYSAASSQGLSPAANNNGEVKKSSSDHQPAQQNHHSPESNTKIFDGWSSRLGVFFLKYQIDNNSACITPRGLTNRSNYCYINAILQALVSCPPFYNLLRSIPTQPSGLRNKSTTPIIDAVTDLVAEFSMMSAPPPIRITRREKGQKREDLLPDVNPDAPFEPTVIHKMLNGIRSDMFQVEGRQEDAEEFLGCILNKMNDEMLEVMKLVDNKNRVANGTIEQNVEEQNDEGSDWQVICGSRNKGSITRTTDFGRTPISDIFRGQLRSRVQREGDASTDVVQPFFTLQLYIEKAASVKEALELLVVKDQLEGVTCSKTKQEVAAWQQVTIEELPIILILHLKCFDYKMDGCTKILKTVEFPIELKIDSKFLSSKNKYTQKQKQYKLFAVVYHDGKEAVKGHYITDVFHAGYNSWIRYDDSIVKPVTEHHVLHPRSPRIPYLLYYRRCDTIGGGGNSSSNSSGVQQQQQSTNSK